MSLAGKKLPALAVSGLKYLKGAALPQIPPPGHPCVLELWATWCGPCRAVFPHLSKIQEKYASSGLQVIGISVEEPSAKVSSFVESNSSNMRYTVAVSEALGQQLMELAQVSGIPHSLVVDRQGQVAFSGHPADPAFETAVSKVCKDQPQELPRVTLTKEELSALPVKELKQILSQRGIGFQDLNEKGELVSRVIERCSNVSYTQTS